MTVESDEPKLLQERSEHGSPPPSQPAQLLDRSSSPPSSQTPPPTNTQSSSHTLTSNSSPHSLQSSQDSHHHPTEANKPHPEEPHEPTSDYIITLKKGTTQEQFDEYKQNLIRQHAVIKHEYNSIILMGFAVSLKPSQLHSFQTNPQVQAIEPDGKVHI